MYRILLTTSGGGNAQNLVRSLRSSDLSCYIVGVNADKFELAKSNADKNYLVPRFSNNHYLKTIEEILEREKIDFMIPNHELEIQFIVKSRNKKILSKCFLPKREVVDLCIDKFALTTFLKNRGIGNIPKSYMFDHFKYMPDLDFPLWARLIKGSGSQGAMLVNNFEELRFWVTYWKNNRGVGEEDFMVSEYLPGKDYHYFSLWKDGTMIIGKSIERVRYCCSKYTLTGTSSSPSLCKVIVNPHLDKITERIIKTIDPKAQGLYGIDYKGSSKGVDCLTEINIGRSPRINYIFNLGSKPNITELYVKCGLNIPFSIQERETPKEELYFIRDFDTPPLLKTLTQIENYERI